jgi:hypothetical protein
LVNKLVETRLKNLSVSSTAMPIQEGILLYSEPVYCDFLKGDEYKDMIINSEELSTFKRVKILLYLESRIRSIYPFLLSEYERKTNQKKSEKIKGKILSELEKINNQDKTLQDSYRLKEELKKSNELNEVQASMIRDKFIKRLDKMLEEEQINREEYSRKENEIMNMELETLEKQMKEKQSSADGIVVPDSELLLENQQLKEEKLVSDATKEVETFHKTELTSLNEEFENMKERMSRQEKLLEKQAEALEKSKQLRDRKKRIVDLLVSQQKKNKEMSMKDIKLLFTQNEFPKDYLKELMVHLIEDKQILQKGGSNSEQCKKIIENKVKNYCEEDGFINSETLLNMSLCED